MLKTLLFILILLSVNSFVGKGQGSKWRYEGPRVGFDLSRFMLPAFQSGSRHGWEVQGDIPYKGNWFPTVELGMEWFDDKQQNFHYLSNGIYGRLGVDLNIAKFESLKDHDLVFLGVRYGYSNFNQEAKDIYYLNYWGGLNTDLPTRSMSAHWGELVFGMKGQLFSNFFLGWTIRGKFPLFETNDPNIKPFIIPGLGKTTGELPVAFTFTVSYRFPIFRTRTLPKPIKIGGAKHPGERSEENTQFPSGSQYVNPGR
jgi:hypothetical protein